MAAQRSRPEHSPQAERRADPEVRDRRTAALAIPALLLLTWMLEGGALSFEVHPFLQHVTSTSAIVTWETRALGTTMVAYGTAAPLSERAVVAGRRRLHQVTLTGLQPGQRYVYRVSTRTASGDEIRERPQLLVHCGDLVGRGREKREWVTEFFDPARDLLAHVPLQSVLGNHEEDARHWYRYTANPVPDASPPPARLTLAR